MPRPRTTGTTRRIPVFMNRSPLLPGIRDPGLSFALRRGPTATRRRFPQVNPSLAIPWPGPPESARAGSIQTGQRPSRRALSALARPLLVQSLAVFDATEIRTDPRDSLRFPEKPRSLLRAIGLIALTSFAASPAQAATLTRGPYLQLLTTHS